MAQRVAVSSASKNIWDFDPRTVGGCVLWFDGADNNTILNSSGNPASTNDSVYTWKDKSGNGYHATGNAGFYPTYIGNGCGINFSGQYLYNTSTNFQINEHTVFMVTQSGYNNFTSGNHVVFSLFNGVYSSNGVFYGTNFFGISSFYIVGNGGYSTNNNWFVPTNGVPWKKAVYSTVYNRNNSVTKSYVSGSDVTTAGVTIGASAYGTITRFAIGAGFDSPNYVYRYEGPIFEIIVYNNSITDTYKRQQLEGYLAWKWGFQGSLPTTHPYYPTSIVIPTQISGCALWLDAADTSTVFINGSSVTSWNDKSGNGNNGISNPTYNSYTNPTNALNFPVATPTTISFVFGYSLSSYREGLTVNNLLTSAGFSPSTFNVTNAVITSVVSSYSCTVSGNGTTATYTLSSTQGLVVGSTVTVTGFSTAAFNGTFTMASQTSTTFTVANSTNSGGTLSGGTVSSGYNFGINAMVTVSSTSVGSNSQATTSGTVTYTNINYPTYSNTGISFTGVPNTSSQYFKLTSSLLPTGTTDRTYFMVSKSTGARSAAAFIHGNYATNQSIYLSYTTTTEVFSLTNVVYASSSTTVTNVNILSGNVSSLVLNGWLNGTPLTTNNGQSVPSMNIGTGSACIGMAYVYSDVFSGTIYEIIVYNTALSTAQRQQVEGYLAWKWGLNRILSSSNPYANITPTIAVRPQAKVFRPIDVPECALWLDAADPSTITLSGSSVTQWNDKSGNGRNAVSSGGVYVNPVYGSVSWNNTPIISFSNTDSEMQIPNFLISTQARSVFFVYQVPSTYPAGRSIALLTRIASGAQSLSIGNANAAGIGVNSIANRVLTNTGYNNTNILIFCVINSSTSAGNNILTFNGTSQTLSTSSAAASYETTAQTYQLGVGLSRNGSYGVPFNLAEIMEFAAELSTSQRQQVEGYLAWKWGLVSSLPSTHPFYKIPTNTVNPFTPKLLSGLSLWLDAADGSSMILSGSNVTQWNDKSGNARNGTAVNSPALQTNTLNGLPVITFNSSSSQYFNFGNIMPIGTSQIYVFSVFKFNDSSDGSIIAKSRQASGGGRWFLIRESGSGGLQFDIGLSPTIAGTSVFSDTSTNSRLITSYWDRSNVYIYENGTSKNSGVLSDSGTSLPNNDVLLVGAYPNSTGTTPPASGFYLNGYIAEIIVYIATLSTAQRQQVEGYLAWKWGLQGNLPTTHAYYKIKP